MNHTQSHQAAVDIHPRAVPTAPKSSTHWEYVGDGYYVTIQHCEFGGCNEYLGVNYPSRFCDEHPLPDASRNSA